MKRNIITLTSSVAIVLLMMITSVQAGFELTKKVGDIDTKLTFFGLIQLDAVGGEGTKIMEANSATQAETNLAFRAQRLRFGWKYASGKIRGKVLLDFNQSTTAASDHTNGAAISKLVQDAFISYVVDPGFVVKAGLLQVPNGMNFTMSVADLDIAELGFDKQLAMERTTGIMLSGRDMGLGNNAKVSGFETGLGDDVVVKEYEADPGAWKGFGYDVLIANQSNRSGAVNSLAMGGNTYAVRGMFNYTEKLHLEASYAKSENADGTVNGKDYSNINIGIDSSLGDLSLRAEYFDAKNILGTTRRDEQTFTATVGYYVTPAIELATKHVEGNATWADATSNTRLGNTYVGFNYFLAMPNQDFSRKSKKLRNSHKLVFNYIIATGDTGEHLNSQGNNIPNKWNGLGGYRGNAFVVQYQYKF